MNSYQKRLQEIKELEWEVSDRGDAIDHLKTLKSSQSAIINQLDSMINRMKKEVKIWVFTGIGLGIMLSGAALALHWVIS